MIALTTNVSSLEATWCHVWPELSIVTGKVKDGKGDVRYIHAVAEQGI